MKKKHSIMLIYCAEILSLFGLSIYYQALSESLPIINFATGFGKRLGYYIEFFWLTFFISWLFFVIIFFIYRKLSAAFILFVPLLLFLIGLIVHLLGDFILWITQLRPALSNFQELFLLASISTTVLMIWIFGDLFWSQANDRSIKHVR